MKEDYFVDQEHVEVTQRLECFPQNSPPSSSQVNGKTHTAPPYVWNNSPTGLFICIGCLKLIGQER